MENQNGNTAAPSTPPLIDSNTEGFSSAPKIDGHLTVNTEFSSSQLTQMAQWEIDAGRLTIEQANQMLAADGAPQIKTPVDPNSPEAYIDSLMPPADRKQFTLPDLKFTDDPSGKGAQQVDTLARGWLSEARFTREIGNFISEEAARTSTRYEKMSAAERNSYRNDQASMLQRMWKGDTNRQMNLAKSLINHLEEKSPGIKELLESTGAGNNALIISKFAMQAELLLKRNGK